MCLMPRAPTPPPVAPAPTREQVVENPNSETNIAKTREQTKRRLGVFGNLKTTPMGDASYGNNVASFAMPGAGA